MRANFQPCFGQCLNDAFSYLLGFLDTDVLVRTFFEALKDRRRNYRNHLMLINQMPTLRVAQNRLRLRSHLNCCIQSLK